MVNRLANLINVCLGKNIPFVAFRLPNQTNIYTWIQRSGKFLMVEKFEEVANKTGFVYAPFHRRTNFPVVFFEPETIVINDDFDHGLINSISKTKPLYPDYNLEIPIQISKNEYLFQAEKFLHSFSDQFTKAVLSRVKLLDKPSGFNVGNYFLELLANYPEAFCHLIHFPGAGSWAGATPETLLQMDQQTARTMALAGTNPSPGPGKQVTWEEKEIEEQNIVTKYITGILTEFGIMDFEEKNTRNQSAGNVVHLISEFNFNSLYLDNRLAEFINKLQPTPAVCGLPKDKAVNLILETEKHNREYYAGFCGPVNYLNKTDLFVNLRCMKIIKEHFALFVGGGLTAKSDPEKEWEETELKSETLVNIIK